MYGHIRAVTARAVAIKVCVSSLIVGTAWSSAGGGSSAVDR